MSKRYKYITTIEVEQLDGSKNTIDIVSPDRREWSNTIITWTRVYERHKAEGKINDFNISAACIRS